MIRARSALLATAMLVAGTLLWEGRHAHAQEAAGAGADGGAGEAAGAGDPPLATVRPRPRPEGPPEGPIDAPPPVLPGEDPAAPGDAAPAMTGAPARGPVTNMPLPRFVSLKGNEGNARRGPGLTNRIDWVFTHAGMPLRLTAEHDNWRRVEDAEGMGGWVHYALLSGVRTVLVTADTADFRNRPDPDATVLFRAEAGVIGRILECNPDWCRVSIEGEKGWASKADLWGSDPGEIVE
jgi:SH3-like domain-containing protein